LKDDLQYTPTDCLLNFPFPANFRSSEAVEAIGKRYYEFRGDLMVNNNEGLTKTYTRFNDPQEESSDTLKLHGLQGEMDRSVLDIYGWKEIKPTCGFGLDYLDLDEDELPDDLPEALWFATA